MSLLLEVGWPEKQRLNTQKCIFWSSPETLLNVNSAEYFAEQWGPFWRHSDREPGVFWAIKGRKPASSRGPQQCGSPGLPLLWENKKGCGAGKTGQYHSVFQEGILLYVCLNNILRGIIDQHYSMKGKGSLNGFKLFLNCFQMNATQIKLVAFGEQKPAVKSSVLHLQYLGGFFVFFMCTGASIQTIKMFN